MTEADRPGRAASVTRRTPVATVWAVLTDRLAPLAAETVPLEALAGRVLAEAVVSPVDVPSFDRAAMDGYAVRAADTQGATATTPRPLEVVGDAFPGRPYASSLGPGQAVRIRTGAPVPPGADAVVMIEHTRTEHRTDGTEAVLIGGEVAAGRNVSRVGEDVRKGAVVLEAGRRLRPQDVGLLAAVGVTTGRVVRQPRVAVLATGDELLPPGHAPTGYRIVDSNTPMLAALVARDGGRVLPPLTTTDEPGAIRATLGQALAAGADVILVSGGTSVGSEDHVPAVVAELGELIVHGVALKPAGPTGLGLLPRPQGNGPPVPVFLLPGNPVSCLCAYDLFAGRAVRRLGGRSEELPYHRVIRPLAADVASAAARVDYLRVRLEADRVIPLGISGASNLSSAVRADGFVLVPAERERLAAGEPVEVWLYDE